ncbi:hypothetical protein ACXR6G_13525 [Ancylomarina sp. YFZ004]
MYRTLHVIFILFISNLVSLSQNTQTDYTLNCDSALLLYQNEIHHEFDYVIGREYKIYHSYKQDNPYLNSRHGKGTIYSNGYVYGNKIILYDMHKDVLVVNTLLNKSSNINIEIQKVKVDSFSIEFDDGKYLFHHLKKNEQEHNQISNGFYEIPHKGKFQLLLRHNSDKGNSEGITTYTYNIIKYLKIDNAYFNINSRKKFINLFPDYKKQVKKKLRYFNSTYNEFTTAQLIELIKFTETL